MNCKGKIKMYSISQDDVFAVYQRLKDKYNLVITRTSLLDEGFTIDCPIIVGKDHGQTIWLYACEDMFVMDVLDEVQNKGVHWHPYDVESASEDIEEFMNGKSDYFK